MTCSTVQQGPKFVSISLDNHHMMNYGQVADLICPHPWFMCLNLLLGVIAQQCIMPCVTDFTGGLAFAFFGPVSNSWTIKTHTFLKKHLFFASTLTTLSQLPAKIDSLWCSPVDLCHHVLLRALFYPSAVAAGCSSNSLGIVARYSLERPQYLRKAHLISEYTTQLLIYQLWSSS